MPAPNLRTVRRSRSQSVETASGVFMVSPEAVDDGQEFSPSRSQIAKKVGTKLRSVRRLAGCATSRQALPATLAQRPALKLTFEVDAEPISPPKPCWYKPPAAPPRPQAPCSQPCSSPQPLTRIAAAVARAACCAGPCRSPCAADRGQFRTAAAACKAAAPTTAVRVRPPPPPSRQRRAPERHRARSPRARFRFRGLFAPAGTPAPIVAKMNKDATEIISTADVAFDITWIGATQPEALPPLAATVGGRGGCQQPRRGTFLRASLTPPRS